MPSALVNRLGQRREMAEFKSVLNDAQNHVMLSVDVEHMAQDLVQSGGKEYVDMVRALTADLSNAKKELDQANRRYEQLVADLKKRGISLTEVISPQEERPTPVNPPGDRPSVEPKSSADEQAEWEEWDRRFRALLD